MVINSEESHVHDRRFKPRAHCPVLIVEDDGDLREMMAQMLTIEGFQAVAVANGHLKRSTPCTPPTNPT